MRTICDHDGVFAGNGLIGDGFSEVNGKKDGVVLLLRGVKGCLEEDCVSCEWVGLRWEVGIWGAYDRYYQSSFLRETRGNWRCVSALYL
jgi:hypothetical protein